MLVDVGMKKQNPDDQRGRIYTSLGSHPVQLSNHQADPYSTVNHLSGPKSKNISRLLIEKPAQITCQTLSHSPPEQ